MNQGGYGGGNPGGGGWAPPPGGGGYGPPPGGAPPGGGGYGQPPGGYGQPLGQAPGGGAAPGAAYAQPAPQGQAGSSAPLGAALDKGFVGALFDFSFSSFITTKIIKVIYGLLIFASVLAALGMIINGISQFVDRYGSPAVGILMIVLSPLALILYVVLARLYCELIVMLFRIAETLGDINRKTKE